MSVIVKKNLISLLLLLLFSYQVEASDITGLFNTGVDNAGNVLANNQLDSHYTLVNNSTYSATAVGSAIAVTSAFGFPVSGPWLANNTTSEWVIPSANYNVYPGSTSSFLAGNYDYQTTFNFNGAYPNSSIIIGQWATDDPGIDILLNGVSLGISNNVGYTPFTPFTIASNFLTGVNTLDFIVYNAVGPTGLRVELAEVPSLVPEAQEWAMMLLGLSLLTSVSRRK